MLVGRDEDLVIVSNYIKNAKTTVRRNLGRYKYKTIMAEAKDRRIRDLRSWLIYHESHNDSKLASQTRDAIRLHMLHKKLVIT